MIYFDNAATMPPTQAALAAAKNAIENFGNPSSMHILGINAERIINNARQEVANALNVPPKQIIFTSGATESNNTVIRGVALKKHLGSQIITTAAEHPSMLEPIKALENQGFSVVYLPLNSSGEIEVDALANALKTKTCLVATHHINSETGVVQNISAIANVVKQNSAETLLHIDCVQSFCKYPLNFSVIKADFASFSAHKIGGLKGAGALYIRQGVSIAPLILGGGQENDIRSGTENTVSIASFSAIPKYIKENYVYVQNLKREFISRLDFKFSENFPNSSPYILNISLDGIRGEVLINALSAKGVYISAGSACSNNKDKADENIFSVRISFSYNNTINEIEQATEIINEEVKKLLLFRGLR